MTQTNFNQRREISGALMQTLVQYYEADPEVVCMAIGDFHSLAVRWLRIHLPEAPVAAAPATVPTEASEAPAATKVERKPRKKTDEKAEEKLEPAVQEVAEAKEETLPEAPPAPTEPETAPAVSEPAEAAAAVEMYDPANKEHKRRLALILKGAHNFNLDTAAHQRQATAINHALKGTPLSDDALMPRIADLITNAPPF